MADQVNPLGGLAAGMNQLVPMLAASPLSKPPPTRSVESKPKAEDSGKADVPKESLEAAAQSVEEFLQQSPSNLKFGVDRETGMYFFKVVDQATQETIRQVPSEDILAMARRLRALDNPKDASGILVDKEG